MNRIIKLGTVLAGAGIVLLFAGCGSNTPDNVPMNSLIASEPLILMALANFLQVTSKKARKHFGKS